MSLSSVVGLTVFVVKSFWQDSPLTGGFLVEATSYLVVYDAKYCGGAVHFMKVVLVLD